MCVTDSVCACNNDSALGCQRVHFTPLLSLPKNCAQFVGGDVKQKALEDKKVMLSMGFKIPPFMTNTQYATA